MYRIIFPDENKTEYAREGETLLQIMQRAGIPVYAACGGNGTCGKCGVILENGAHVKACEYVPVVAGKDKTGDGSDKTGDGSVSVFCKKTDTEPSPVLPSPVLPSPALPSPVLSFSVSPELPCAAGIDLGTTTLAAYLLDASGRELAAASRRNPQAAYGADVLSRAQYTIDHSAEPLSGCIRRALQEMLEELALAAGINREEIKAVAVAGNTCMHHLFLGLDVRPLVQAPYVPAVTEALVLRAADYGLTIHPDAKLMMLPNIGGFVGADTAACLLSTRLAEQKEWTLLVDIGTNGEMVLGKEHRLTACSAAAGPAFEGAGISCGMYAGRGAVSAAHWSGNFREGSGRSTESPEDTFSGTEESRAQGSCFKAGNWELAVIGDEEPAGICGSGILDVAAQLLLSGQMDASGRLLVSDPVVLYDPVRRDLEPDPAVPHEAVRGDLVPDPAAPDDAVQRGITPSGRTGHVPVLFTQKDVRALQLAKGAIAAGIECLAAAQGIDVREIQQVWLAGAFGNFLSPESACAIGLLPPELSGRIRAVGNAAGTGVKRILRLPDAWEYVQRIAKETAVIELADIPEFQERFIRHMQFP